MSVTILLRGPIKAHVKPPRYVIEIGESTILGEMLQKLIEGSVEIQRFWNSPDSVDRDALVLLNETDIGLTGGLASEVNDGDVIVILPLVHGG
ncbi:hypothetical protein EU522_00125 [Candidatus Thorarchaeota archaeon]|nr:MAG: hypothetical protein EU522_00125 [Candidatus Thorarchaeota archaeon]